MYCSKSCCDNDWLNVHFGSCNTKIQHDIITLDPIKLQETKSADAESEDHAFAEFASVSLINHLINFVGIQNIRRAALEKKPMSSLTEDPRTKGFEDGKFEAASLEALLSLEDNFKKTCIVDLEVFVFVSILYFVN
jgi:hypothetical protein